MSQTRIVGVLQQDRWQEWFRRLTGDDLSPHALRVAIGTVALSGATLVGNIVIVLVLSRLLGAQGYGIFAFALATTAFLGVAATMGLTPLVIRSVAAYRQHGALDKLRGIVRQAQQAVTASSLVLALAAVPVGFAIGSTRPEVLPAYWLALLLVPISALTTVRQAAIQGYDRVLLGRVPETVVQPSVFLVLIVVTAAAGRLTGTTSVAIHLVAVGVAFALGLVFLHRTVPDGVWRTGPAYETRLWARAAMPLLLLTGVNTMNQQVDVLLLGTMRGAADAGMYSVAFRAAGVVSFFLLAAGYPLSPLLARLVADRQWDQLQRLVTQAARIIFALSLAVSLALVIFSTQALRIFGPEFVAARPALIVLCLGQLVNTGTGLVGNVLVMSGNERDVAAAVGVGALLGLGLNLALIPPFGMVGAALATSASIAVTNLLLLARLQNKTGVWAAALGTPRAGVSDVRP